MGNSVQKFIVKNETDFNVFFLVTEKKQNLDIEDIRPGKVVKHHFFSCSFLIFN